jgi:hypothetical protein
MLNFWKHAGEMPGPMFLSMIAAIFEDVFYENKQNLPNGGLCSNPPSKSNQ